MVGSGGDRRKEAVEMMALHEALRTTCLNSDWAYSVFWTIRPRPRVRGGNGCKVGDDNGSLMLMWEDGFCRGRVSDYLEEMDREDPVRKSFSKMSIQLYNYGEGLMGKVASDKCHKWVFKEPTESETNISNYWQSSFDALPPEWTDQFDSGIQTIAVIQAGHGLLQLGSCKIIPEDLHFVLRMRHTFESLGYQSGLYISQLFSSTRNTFSSTELPSKPISTTTPIRPPPPLFNWGQRPLSSASMLSSPNFQQGFPQPQARDDETHMSLMPHTSETARMEDMIGEGEHDQNDIKWPNGLSFFNALTTRTDDSKILFNPESMGNKPGVQSHHHPLNTNPTSDDSSMQIATSSNLNEFLSLDTHHEGARKMEKFKRNFPLSSASNSMDQHQQAPLEYRNSEGGMYQDVMDTILE
ncbi:hypothetical protein TanjilG_15204 [Lupinus angustifolius]|uniref:Transcription factor MYC/MYB N-terminal domain-containing protein n=1 Tax=Lupinus angustifolius TaxID=3871 RepID=A0A1J7I5X4_LUPAN|nr:PREDICTED: transcription factor LHW-like [Lupinus angustifolius]OIW08243.1 hypothetical protein TanjilG_15204 [Lupinus angustifolius]